MTIDRVFITRTGRLLAAFSLFAGIALVFIGSASAAPPGPKVTICHRTASQSNPYVSISVAQDSVDGDLANDNGQGDHYLEHRGPVGPIAQGEWGDIIPPIPGVHAGYNWTAEGQAIYNAGCGAVSTTTTTVADTTTTVPDTTTTTVADTTTTVPDTTTTTVADTTTTTVADTTTTTAAVLSETTIREQETTTTTAAAPAASVKGVAVVQSADTGTQTTASGAQANTLAVTGAPTGLLVALGLTMIAIGAAVGRYAAKN